MRGFASGRAELDSRNRAGAEIARATDEHKRLHQAWVAAGSLPDPSPRCDRCGNRSTGIDGHCRNCDPPAHGERDERIGARR